MAFADLPFAQGGQNMGGLIDSIYYCPSEDIDFDPVPTLNADGITVTGDIVCKTGKEFIQIYFTKGTGKLDSNVVGERDGRSKENMVEFQFPGNSKALASFEKQALNTPCVVIVKDSDGTMRILGMSVNASGALNLDLPAYLENSTSSTGAKSADKRGFTFAFKSEAAHNALFYEGDVQLTPTA